MLKGISPLLSPELLKALCEMGHGDEIILADANFPVGDGREAGNPGRRDRGGRVTKGYPAAVPAGHL